MSVNLSNALIITVLGMGLVFCAIVLLWGVMALLVKIAPMRTEVDQLQLEQQLDQQQTELERKRRAALAAVTVALAKQKENQEPQLFPEPPTALVSAWQAVMRTKMLNKRGPTR